MVNRDGRGRPVSVPMAAFSLVELMVVVAILGILALIAVASITNVTRTGNEQTAAANLEHLNKAVLRYNHAVAELTNATNSGIDDERTVFTNLQWDGSVIDRPGSPYLEASFSLHASSATNTYRAVWNGRMYQLVFPGSNGTGIDLMKLQQ